MSDSNVATINKPPIVALRERLLDRRSELRSALPSDIDPDHFIRAVTTAAQINPDLQACSFSSLWLACMRACRDGLLPDGVQGAIVPFKSSCSWIPMYQGLLKKFRQSGQCKWITAQIVRNGEEFVHHIDEGGEKFRHVPGDDDTLPIEKVYAAALTKDGAFYITVLSMNEIKKIQNLSKASREDAPWKVWPTEMMKKTALRRLAKLLPSGRDILDDDDNLPITPGPSLASIPIQSWKPIRADRALRPMGSAARRCRRNIARRIARASRWRGSAAMTASRCRLGATNNRKPEASDGDGSKERGRARLAHHRAGDGAA
jgi:phage RecT family recombinase